MKTKCVIATTLVALLSVVVWAQRTPKVAIPIQAWETEVITEVNGERVALFPSFPSPSLLGGPCCSEAYPSLVQLNFYQRDVNNEQILAFSATGVGPYNNEDDPIEYALGDHIAIGWFANAFEQPIYRVRVETFTYQPDGSAIVETDNYYGDEFMPGFENCDDGWSLTYGIFSAALLIETGLVRETRVTCWECPDAEPITISVFWNVTG